MSLIIDIIVILTFAVSLISGIKKGFVRSVIKIVIVIAAILGAVIYTPDVSDYLNKNYIQKSVVSSARNSITRLTSDGVDIDMLTDERPTAFLKVLDRFGADIEDIRSFVAANGYTDEEKIDKIAEYMASPVSKALSKAIAFVLLFIGIWLLLTILGKIVCMIFKLPILSAADKLLGCVFGALSGLILAWGISVVICGLTPHLSVIFDGSISEAVIENSVIVKYLGNFDPFSLVK